MSVRVSGCEEGGKVAFGVGAQRGVEGDGGGVWTGDGGGGRDHGGDLVKDRSACSNSVSGCIHSVRF